MKLLAFMLPLVLIGQTRAQPACDPGYSEGEDGNCYLDCEVGDWRADGTCSATCGCGVQKQVRDIIRSPEAHGKACPQLEQFIPCKIADCEFNCELGPWENVDTCNATCGGGMQLQKRKVLQHPNDHGVQCGELTQWVSCNEHPCAVDCEVGEWYQSGKCSKGCGAGVEIWKRDVLTPSAHGGAACPEVEEERECFVGHCPVQLRMWKETVVGGDNSVSDDELENLGLPTSEPGCRNMEELVVTEALTQCTAKCNQVDSCKSFTFNDETAHCCFKTTTDERQFNTEGVHSFEKCGVDGCEPLPDEFLPFPRTKGYSWFQIICAILAIAAVGYVVNKAQSKPPAEKLFTQSPFASPQRSAVADVPASAPSSTSHPNRAPRAPRF